MDFTPARDTSIASGLDQSQAQAKRISNERQMIAKLDPKVLEDRYLRLYDDHYALKQHARNQEDKIKKLATKLMKVIEERKKSDVFPLEKKTTTRNVEQENFIAELQSKVSELQEQNKLLKQRVTLAQQQIQAAQPLKKSSTYDGVSSRIDTGQPKRLPATLYNNIRVIGPNHSARNLGVTPRINSSLLDEARMTNQQLEESLNRANDQLRSNEEEIEQLRRQLKQREQEFEQQLIRLRSQTSGGDSRQNLQENIDMIRLQRDLREKSEECRRFQSLTENLDSENRSMKSTNNELLHQIDRLDQQIKDEQQRVMNLRSELRNSSRPNTRLDELSAEIETLRRERDLLREANAKISNSAFNADREQEFREKERALRLQIAQLEATIKADLGERGLLLDRLTTEKNTKRDADEETRSMRLKYLEIKEKYDDLAEKMKFFERESDINMKEIEEALIILRQRKEKKELNFDFLEKVDDERSQNLNRRVLELETQLAEMSAELEKTRNILTVQYKLNKDYKLEVDCIKRKLDENQSEYSARIVESGQLLDIRANRIQKLEKALQDVAYGTRPVNLKTEPEMDGEINDQLIEEQIELERGETLIEIHLSRLNFTDRALEHFGKGFDPSTFCSIEFFEHELEMTPVIKGRTPEYDFTAQYKVKVDDFLLFYLQNEYTIVELHQAIGQTYETIAACKISLKTLIDENEGRIIRTAQLIGTNEKNIDIGTFANLQYWVRLRVPLKQSFRLLKEKLKAQGYMESAAARSLKESHEKHERGVSYNNANELSITILNCSKVKGEISGHQPDLFCVYKFYDFDDHVTTTITSSNNPNFDDHQSFSLLMDADLDQYLKEQQLVIYLFDDQDKREQHYLARASIPLMTLAHDNDIKGIFELFNEQGNRNGTINVVMKWVNRYIPPKSSTRTPGQRKIAPSNDVREPLALLPDESTSGLRSSTEKHRKLQARVRPKDILGSDNERSSSRLNEPKTSASTPKTSISKTKDQHQRTSRSSSNASIGSKRVSFDQRPRTKDASPDEKESSGEDTIEDPFPSGRNTRLAADDREIESDDDLSARSRESNIDQPIKEQSPRSESDDTPDAPEIPERMKPDESDSDIFYVEKGVKAKNRNGGEVQIGVDTLVLNKNCSAFENENCEKVFVSVEFLDYPPEELETPLALDLDEPDTKKNFGFLKTFSVRDANKKQKLADLVGSNSNGEIRFVIVGEPPETDQDDLECVDIGYSVVNAKEILQKQKDVVDQNIDVYDMEDEQVIGKMKVTVSILDALHEISGKIKKGPMRN